MGDDEDIEGEDEEGRAEYSLKSEFSKPKLVEEAVRKCIESRSKEMKEGYHNYKIDVNGDITAKIWIPDTRKVYDSHVIALRNLLSPEIKKDKGFLKEEKIIADKKKKLYKKYCYYVMKQKMKDKKIMWVRTGDKKIPETDEAVVIQDVISKAGSLLKGGWNSKITDYWNNMVLLNDDLFSELNKLTDKLNYFKSKTSF